MCEWEECKLGDIVTFQRGFDITKKEQIPGIYPVVSSSGVKSYHKSAKVKGPGITIGRKGTLGTVFYLKTDFWPHDTTLWVKDFHGNIPSFIYYFLKEFHFELFDVGSSNPTLNRNHIHLLATSLPPLPEQRAIASVLSSLDDKIARTHTKYIFKIFFLYRFQISHHITSFNSSPSLQRSSALAARYPVVFRGCGFGNSYFLFFLIKVLQRL